MILELGIIMLCMIVVAVEPSEKLYRRYKNWSDRKALHAEWLKGQQNVD